MSGTWRESLLSGALLAIGCHLVFDDLRTCVGAYLIAVTVCTWLQVLVIEVRER